MSLSPVFKDPCLSISVMSMLEVLCEIVLGIFGTLTSAADATSAAAPVWRKGWRCPRRC